ncbi:unnamed protein product [Lota lota]
MHATLRAQGKQIHHHEEQLTSICQGVRELAERNESFQSSICGQVKSQWSLEADLAFRRLRQSFTLAPILTLPDSRQQFIVEV